MHVWDKAAFLHVECSVNNSDFLGDLRSVRYILKSHSTHNRSFWRKGLDRQSVALVLITNLQQLWKKYTKI